MKDTLEALRFGSILAVGATVGGLLKYANTSEGFMDTASRTVAIFTLTYVLMKLWGGENKQVAKGCALHVAIPTVMSAVFLFAACSG